MAPWVAAILATGIALGVALAVATGLGSLTFASDDSYIYSGYVKMAYTPGAGLFSYNVGEHSAGTTDLAHYYVQALLLLPWFTVVRRPPSPAELELLAWVVAWLCSAATALLIARAAVTMGARVGLDRGWRRTLAALCLTAGRPALPVGLLAALLCATRPEWIPVAALLPAAVARLRSPTGSRRRDLAVGYAAFIGGMLVLFLPLRLTTGQWQPEAYGARAHLTLRRILRPDWAGLAAVFSHHWTLLLGLGAALAAWAGWRQRSCRSALAIPATLAVFLTMRGMFKLTDFNVHDRYISYLWPAMVMGMVPALALALRERSPAAATAEGGARRRALPRAAPLLALVALAALAAVGAGWGLRHGVALLLRDGREMQQVVKTPSAWMAANLPSGSVVCMEPAGAIRTFTDFKLVDRTGLTTRHYGKFKAGGGDPIRDYCDYLRANDVAYAFDYPEHMPQVCASLRILSSWEAQPRWQSGGRIAVMEQIRGGPPPLADPW